MLYLDLSKGIFPDYVIANNNSSDDVKKFMFDSNECNQIINLSNSYQKGDGKIQDGKLDSDFRKVTRWKLPNDTNTAWIYDRVCKTVLFTNDFCWDFDIDFIEDLELIKYEFDPKSSIQDHYKRHSDFGGKMLKRKISYSAQLSPENDYQGCELVIHSEKDIVIPKEQGQITLFPSFILHTVTEITQGTRWSLVTWVSGRPLR